MSDIIERLRACGSTANAFCFDTDADLVREAADEIEKLRGREKILIKELEEVKEERDAAVRLLRLLIAIEGPQPGTFAWANDVQEFLMGIDAARGEK